jgi:hypothetical protein
LYCGPDAPYLPVITIQSPNPTREFAIGQRVNFSAVAQYYDLKTQITDGASFKWDVNLAHCQGAICHQHSAIESMFGRSGSFVVEDHNPNPEQYYFYELTVTVTDACGRADRATRTIKVRGFGS